MSGGIALMLQRVALAVTVVCAALAAEPAKTDLRFEVTVAKKLAPEARDGRLLLVLAPDDGREPRKSIGDTGLKAPPLLGVDVNGFTDASKIVVDQKAIIFPIAHLA